MVELLKWYYVLGGIGIFVFIVVYVWLIVRCGPPQENGHKLRRWLNKSPLIRGIAFSFVGVICIGVGADYLIVFWEFTPLLFILRPLSIAALIWPMVHLVIIILFFSVGLYLLTNIKRRVKAND